MKDELIDKMNAEKSPFQSAIVNLEFHNFEEYPVFIGIFKDTQMVGDEVPFKANIFINLETGEDVFVANNYSIEKSIKLAKEKYQSGLTDLVFRIEYLGKTVIKGKPFCRFNIGYCTLDEYEKYDKSVTESIPTGKKK